MHLQWPATKQLSRLPRSTPESQADKIRARVLDSPRYEALINSVGFLCVVSAPLWVYGLFFPFPSGFPIENNVPMLISVLAVILLLQLILISTVTAGDRFMGEVMLIGFLFKLAAVSAYMFMSIRVYESVADVFYYYSSALRIVDNFSLTGNWTFLRPFWSTNFIIMLISCLVVTFGPAFQALMVLFATLSFWGQYLLYRAFCIAFPMRQHKAAALFMFFLPSIVFWTATIGKDAVVLFCTGACCYAFGKMAQTRLSGFVMTLISLAGVMLVRPHIAAMLVISLTGAYLLSSNRRGLAEMITKSIGVPLLLLASIYFITQARTFLDLRDVEQTQGLVKRVAEVNYQTGGSAFGSSLPYRLLAAPFLLFRPFLWEVRSPQAAIAGIEGLSLMIFFWRRRQVMRLTLRRWRENVFVLFLWIYVLGFSFVFAGSMTNFGLLARQRVMVVPIALMIVLSQPLTTAKYVRS